MASNNRSYARAERTIGFGRLQELMKQHMGDGPADSFLEADESLTLSLYLHFFVALGHETTRVNPVAAAGCAENRWKLGKQKLSLMQRSLGTKHLMAPSSLVR